MAIGLEAIVGEVLGALEDDAPKPHPAASRKATQTTNTRQPITITAPFGRSQAPCFRQDLMPESGGKAPSN